MAAFPRGAPAAPGLRFLLFLLASAPLLLSTCSAAEFHFGLTDGNEDPLFFMSGGELRRGLVSLERDGAAAFTTAAGNPPLDNSSFVLAAERTRRQDPLDGYNTYTGGWNISEKHYWASVGFTAAPLFIIAAVWFLGFGLVLFLIGCYFCCCRRRNYSYSRVAYAASLIILVLFTIAAVIGSVFLYYGQVKFNLSTTRTVDFVVDQANFTAENLKNFSGTLAAAKKVKVLKFFLPPESQTKIDDLQLKLQNSSDELSQKVKKNSKDIHNVLDNVRMSLIVVAAVMLLLAFLGLFCSLLGWQCAVSVLVIIGWILITATFIKSGIFLLLHNVVADTCVAMDDWVQHPHDHTALDDILPCVDKATANDSLYQSKQTALQIVTGVNEVIANFSNKNFPPGTPLVYYNQSGPLAPILCNPFSPDLSSRQCADGGVTFDNAPEVWKRYVCQATGPPSSQTCISVGRFTPDMYSQLTAAVNVSSGLYFYSPFFVRLADCTFVRDTFTTIHNDDCPGLERNTRWVYVGLALVSAAVMLSLIFWVIYARERRHRVYNKERNGLE